MRAGPGVATCFDYCDQLHDQEQDQEPDAETRSVVVQYLGMSRSGEEHRYQLWDTINYDEEDATTSYLVRDTFDGRRGWKLAPRAGSGSSHWPEL
jgi:hypothetical protein